MSRLSAVPCFGQSVVTRQSVTAIAKRRLHCGNGIQIEIDHLLKHCRSGTVAQACRQGFEPRGTFGLHRIISASASFQRFVRLRRGGRVVCVTGS